MAESKTKKGNKARQTLQSICKQTEILHTSIYTIPIPPLINDTLSVTDRQCAVNNKQKNRGKKAPVA